MKNILIIIFALLMASCEYYLGVNQQPEFNNTDTISGLNIFGLLRPDSFDSFNRSFVFVQKLWPVLEYGDYNIVQDVTIRLEHYQGDTIADTITFPMLLPDVNFEDTLYRPLESFRPRPGHRYRLTCIHEEFPDAIGETVFPPEPEIIEGSFFMEGRRVAFSIATDTLTGMLEVYLVMPGYSYPLTRVIPEDSSDTDIEVELPADPQGLQLYVFGYDKKLAVYLGNSNTSLNFNKYRTTISTLESGYGVFGALNYTVIGL